MPSGITIKRSTPRAAKVRSKGTNSPAILPAALISDRREADGRAVSLMKPRTLRSMRPAAGRSAVHVRSPTETQTRDSISPRRYSKTARFPFPGRLKPAGTLPRAEKSRLAGFPPGQPEKPSERKPAKTPDIPAFASSVPFIFSFSKTNNIIKSKKQGRNGERRRDETSRRFQRFRARPAGRTGAPAGRFSMSIRFWSLIS